MSLLALRSGGEQTHSTRLLPRSIVPGASVSSSAAPDSRGFLTGQAGPADTRSLPLQRSTGTCHCPGMGDVPGKLGLSSTKDWEPASYKVGPGGLSYPTQVVSSTLPSLRASPTVGSHPGAGGLLPPQEACSTATWCPDSGGQKLPHLNIHPQGHGSALDPSTTVSVLQTGCLKQQKAQSALSTPTAPTLTSTTLQGWMA